MPITTRDRSFVRQPALQRLELALPHGGRDGPGPDPSSLDVVVTRFMVAPWVGLITDNVARFWAESQSANSSGASARTSAASPSPEVKRRSRPSPRLRRARPAWSGRARRACARRAP
jgi:hypothetical protein